MSHTILIVDDNPDDIELTTIALGTVGREMRVKEALDGEAALELLRDGEDLPGLILLDLKMPGMSGLDTLREIRADDRLRDIQVVIVTSSSLESDRNEAYSAGANDFLHKAFEMDQFNEEVKSLLERWLRTC